MLLIEVGGMLLIEVGGYATSGAAASRWRPPPRICGNFDSMNGRLPLEQSFVWPEILGKRVSGDSQHSTFRRRKIFARHFFGLEHLFFVDLTRFSRIYAQTDLGKRFLAFFALNAPIITSARPKIIKNMSMCV